MPKGRGSTSGAQFQHLLLTAPFPENDLACGVQEPLITFWAVQR